MRPLTPWLTGLLLTTTVLSGCFGSDDETEESDSEPDPSEFDKATHDHAIGNEGFRVTGSLTGTASALADTPGPSAASVQVTDSASSDSEGPLDLATAAVDAHLTGFDVRIDLRQMSTGANLGFTGNTQGGVGYNLPVFGTSGIGPSGLPQTTAYVLVVGMAQVKVGGTALEDWQPLLVAVTQGIREDGAAVTTPDEADLELHVLFPGTTAGLEAFPGQPDGFLYYYFEKVRLSTLSSDEKANVGKGLKEPQTENTPPNAVGKVLVDGEVSSSATQNDRDPVNVTLDATDSNDSDGRILFYIWTIGELNASGEYVPPENRSLAVVSGQTFNYTFTSPGPKFVSLTVTDNRQGTDTFELFFFVNRHLVMPSEEGSIHAGTGSGGASCIPSFNCFDHDVKIHPGIQGATFTFVATSTPAPSNTHVDLYKPGEDAEPDPDSGELGQPRAESQANQPLTVTSEPFDEVDFVYRLYVWWTAGTQITYELEVDLDYTPAVET